MKIYVKIESNNATYVHKITICHVTRNRSALEDAYRYRDDKCPAEYSCLSVFFQFLTRAYSSCSSRGRPHTPRWTAPLSVRAHEQDLVSIRRHSVQLIKRPHYSTPVPGSGFFLHRKPKKKQEGKQVHTGANAGSGSPGVTVASFDDGSALPRGPDAQSEAPHPHPPLRPFLSHCPNQSHRCSNCCSNLIWRLSWRGPTLRLRC